jgi:hypothetical protein
LIGELGYVTGTYSTRAGNARPHALKQRSNAVKERLIATDHDGECGVDRLGFATTDGRVEESDTLFGAGGSHPLRNHRTDGAHIDKDEARMRAFEHTPGPKNSALNFRAIREHGDHDIDAAGYIAGAFAALNPIVRDRVKKRWDDVVCHQLVASFPQVAKHGFSHNAETNKPDLHDNPSSLSYEACF